MRSTVLPSRMTAASRLKSPTMAGAKAKSSAPDSSISDTSVRKMSRA